jgi:hypothetical protein
MVTAWRGPFSRHFSCFLPLIDWGFHLNVKIPRYPAVIPISQLSIVTPLFTAIWTVHNCLLSHDSCYLFYNFAKNIFLIALTSCVHQLEHHLHIVVQCHLAQHSFRNSHSCHHHDTHSKSGWMRDLNVFAVRVLNLVCVQLIISPCFHLLQPLPRKQKSIWRHDIMRQCKDS